MPIQTTFELDSSQLSKMHDSANELKLDLAKVLNKLITLLSTNKGADDEDDFVHIKSNEIQFSARELELILPYFKITHGLAEISHLQKLYPHLTTEAKEFLLQQGYAQRPNKPVFTNIETLSEVLRPLIQKMKENDIRRVFNNVISQNDLLIASLILIYRTDIDFNLQAALNLLTTNHPYAVKYYSLLASIVLQRLTVGHELQAHDLNIEHVWENLIKGLANDVELIEFNQFLKLIDPLSPITNNFKAELLDQAKVNYDLMQKLILLSTSKFSLNLEQTQTYPTFNDLRLRFVLDLVEIIPQSNIATLGKSTEPLVTLLMRDRNYYTEWKEQLDAKSLLAWLKVMNDQDCRETFTQNLIQDFTTKLSDLIAALPKDADKDSPQVIAMTQLLDHLYESNWPTSFKAILFRHAIDQLIANHSVDSDVLEALEINNRYGFSVYVRTKQAMDACRRHAPDTNSGIFASMRNASASGAGFLTAAYDSALKSSASLTTSINTTGQQAFAQTAELVTAAKNRLTRG